MDRTKQLLDQEIEAALHLREHPRLGYTSRGEDGGEVKLDPIHRELVGACAATQLLNVTAKYTEMPRMRVLREVLKPSTQRWCGGSIAGGEGGSTNRTKDSLAKQMKALPIFSAQMGGCNPKFVTIFLVPKAGTNKARMIADCRDINEGMEKGPPLPFASLDELFYILSYFGAESTYLTADFRHWFYQIPLPHKVRHLFSVKAGDFMGRFDVFPMGFSWSPFVAQGLSMCAAKLAIHKAGLHPVSPLSEDDTVPPLLDHCRQGRSLCVTGG